MCGGVCCILLLPLVARCLETIDVCIWVCGNVCCVAAVVENSGIFESWSVEVCCVFV